MAAAGLTAAPVAAEGPQISAWAARAARRAAAQAAARGKLEAAFARIRGLEGELASLHTILGDPEVAARLLLIAPSLVVGVSSAAGAATPCPTLLQRGKRNLASHEFGIPAKDIASMSQAEVNRGQRRRGKCGLRGVGQERHEAAFWRDGVMPTGEIRECDLDWVDLEGSTVGATRE